MVNPENGPPTQPPDDAGYDPESHPSTREPRPGPLERSKSLVDLRRIWDIDDVTN